MTDKQLTNDVIIFDPVCGIERGHNLPTIKKYAKWLKEEFNFASTACVSLNNIKADKDSCLDFEQIPWVYNYWLPTKNEIKALRNRKVIQHDHYMDMLTCGVHHYYSHIKIKRSLKKTLKMRGKFFFFPGADFYSLSALHSLALEGLVPKDKIIIIRLMGVMETATKIPNARKVFTELLQGIKSILGQQVRISAETEKYALYLSGLLNIEISVTPIPSDLSNVDAINKRQQNKQLTIDDLIIACLGGARADKGYFEIAVIAEKLLNTKATRNVRFRVQGMHMSNPEYNWEYQAKLASLINVVLLPARLTDLELLTEIDTSDLVLLPYSQGTYEQRGSAILFDSLPFGKPIIGMDGTGFGDTIRNGGLGLTYNGYDDLMNKLFQVTIFSEAMLKKIKENQHAYMAKGLAELRNQFND
jgi:glycosyltransferase involved in cell wall biosynthesis